MHMEIQQCWLLPKALTVQQVREEVHSGHGKSAQVVEKTFWLEGR